MIKMQRKSLAMGDKRCIFLKHFKNGGFVQEQWTRIPVKL